MSVLDGARFDQTEARKIYETIPAKYTLYQSGTTYYANTTTAGGTSYQSLDAATVLQNVFDIGGVIYIKNGTWNIARPIDAAVDIEVYCADEVTLKYTGSASTSMFYNSVPIHLKWYGGTIDRNNIAQYPFQFGAIAGSNPASKNLLSCVAENIKFINLIDGAWLCNAVGSDGTNYNTHIRWKNLLAIKGPSATNSDCFQLVGKDVKASVAGITGSSGACVITSAFLFDAEIDSFVYDENFTDVHAKNIALQPYLGNGPFPNFGNIKLKGNGWIELVNGDLTELTTAGSNFDIECVGATRVHIGYCEDQWDTVHLHGFIKASSYVVLAYIKNLVADLVIDCTNLGDDPENSVIYGQPNPEFGGDSIYLFKNLIVTNLANGQGIFCAAPAAMIQSLSVYAGDISDCNGVPLFTSGHEEYWGTEYQYIGTIKGYTPP